MRNLLWRLVRLGTHRALDNARGACDERRRQDLAIDDLERRLAVHGAAHRAA